MCDPLWYDQNVRQWYQKVCAKDRVIHQTLLLTSDELLIYSYVVCPPFDMFDKNHNVDKHLSSRKSVEVIEIAMMGLY